MKRFLRIVCAILAVGLVACSKHEYGTMPDSTIASLGTPSNNEIWFTTTDGRDLMAIDESAFNVEIDYISSSEYGLNVIAFTGELTTIGANAFNGCYNLFNVSLPDSVTEIGEKAFYDCKNIEAFTLGSGLKRCHNMAFDGCFNLHSLHIPSIYSWCNITFDSQSSNPASYSYKLLINKTVVKNLTIPNGIEHIGKYAFYNNSALESVSVPASVKSIGKGAFYGCDYISSVNAANIERWCEIEFEDEDANPIAKAGVLYSNGNKVSSISLASVERIGSYALINCTSVVSFSADDALTNIGTDALRNCTSLTSVSLGSGISELGKRCFMGCKALKSVTCTAQTPPMLSDNNVFAYNHNERKFYVPSSAIEAYRTNEGWGQYANSIESIE